MERMEIFFLKKSILFCYPISINLSLYFDLTKKKLKQSQNRSFTTKPNKQCVAHPHGMKMMRGRSSLLCELLVSWLIGMHRHQSRSFNDMISLCHVRSSIISWWHLYFENLPQNNNKICSPTLSHIINVSGVGAPDVSEMCSAFWKKKKTKQNNIILVAQFLFIYLFDWTVPAIRYAQNMISLRTLLSYKQ